LPGGSAAILHCSPAWKTLHTPFSGAFTHWSGCRQSAPTFLSSWRSFEGKYYGLSWDSATCHGCSERSYQIGSWKSKRNDPHWNPGQNSQPDQSGKSGARWVTSSNSWM